jgi:HPt (histidine-containing phosphotransfer) domain-containing protein
MMSSNDDPASIARGLAAGSNHFLTKPFTRESLLAVLHALEHGGVAAPPQAPAARNTTAAAPLSPEAPVHVDPELLQEVPAFLDSRRRMAETMASALDDGDREQLRVLAHRGAGGLALFGFEWAAWQSRGISARATEGSEDALREDIAGLRRHLRQVQVE